mgnify:CR=1 FL=1
MPISGKEFNSYVLSLNEKIKEKHISRPILVSRATLFFHLSGKEDHRFVISLEHDDPRAYTAKEEYNLVSLDSPIYAPFRKELANAFIEEVAMENDDRILKLSLIVINSVYKEERRTLYFEMFPTHPNLIITDENNKIIAFTHGASLDSFRPILKGVNYSSPEKSFANVETSPFDYSSYQNACLEKEKLIFSSRKKERFGPLLTLLMTKEKRLKKKILLIEKDKEKAKSHQSDSMIGDYIYTNLDSLSNKKELNIDGKIVPLDPKKNLVQNANDFYKKAKKAKKALQEIEIQKETAKRELFSVQDSIALLSTSDEEGLESLSKEWGLLSKKKEKINFGDANIPYVVLKNGTHFLFGKNAKQNDTLTFLIDTVKTHYWFHILGKEGAHVMIKKDHPSEEEILTACEIALLSKGKEDGDVMMSERKNIYKGTVPGQAIVREYTTIHLKHVRNETKTLFLNATKLKLR